MNPFKKKIKEEKTKNVSFLDDAIFMLEHAIGCEEHLLENYAISRDEKWLEIFKKLQKERSKFLYELVPESETDNETYCLCKHLLGRAMGRKELAVRYLSEGKKEKAKECLELAYLYEQLFKHLIGGKK